MKLYETIYIYHTLTKSRYYYTTLYVQLIQHLLRSSKNEVVEAVIIYVECTSHIYRHTSNFIEIRTCMHFYTFMYIISN